MPAISRSSPMAAPARCTPSRSRARSASARSIIPRAPGVFSAFGMLFSDLRYDFVRTWFTRLDDASFDADRAGLSRARGAGPRRDRRHLGHAAEDRRQARRRHALCRPGARGHGRPAAAACSPSRTAPRSSGISTRCTRCATAPRRREERAEIVSLRTTVTGVMRKPPQAKIARGARAAAKAAFTGKRTVYFAAGGFAATPTYRARRAARRQPHQRPGADRGARLDHGAAAGRRAGGRRLRQSGDRGRGHGDAWPGGHRTRRQKKVATRRAPIDPVVTEIVRNGVIAVTEEMKTNLMRTAYNMIIYEALDFTTGLFTAEGDTVSIGIGLPMFIRGMAETVKAKIRAFRPRRTSSRATSSSPTTPTSPAATSTTSPSRCRSSTRASWSASPAAWRTGSTSAARSAA